MWPNLSNRDIRNILRKSAANDDNPVRARRKRQRAKHIDSPVRDINGARWLPRKRSDW